MQWDILRSMQRMIARLTHDIFQPPILGSIFLYTNNFTCLVRLILFFFLLFHHWSAKRTHAFFCFVYRDRIYSQLCRGRNDRVMPNNCLYHSLFRGKIYLPSYLHCANKCSVLIYYLVLRVMFYT